MQIFLKMVQSASESTGHATMPSGSGLITAIRASVSGCVDIMSLMAGVEQGIGKGDAGEARFVDIFD